MTIQCNFQEHEKISLVITYKLQQGLQKRKMQDEIIKYDLHSSKLMFEESNNFT